MFSYIVALSAVLLVFYNPISQFLLASGEGPPPQIKRIPRPQLNTDLLALELDTLDVGNNSSGIDSTTRCPNDNHSIHIFSQEPLVIYVENFLSLEERQHLLEISAPIYEPSTVTHDGGAHTQRDAAVRDSEVALVPRTAAVRCVEDRVRGFQGWRDEVWVERLRVQRYGPGGHYGHHFDWSASRGGWGRVSTFMVFVDDDAGALRGGGTEFPRLRRPRDPRWCRFIECAGEGEVKAAEAGESWDQDYGVVFRPVAGNAVFWENFRSDNTGRGYEETWHAGLPVEEGVKVGLNIWSWGMLQ